jgi:cytochrome c oxidase subunit 2
MHLQLNQPVQLLLRSKDVLHDFYVPPFRARMNLVPGMVTRFWFTPTRAGRYDILCAQLCGVGHYNMRGYVVVEDKAAYDAWLSKQPTFEQTLSGQTPSSGLNPIAQGKALAQSKGCVACHCANGATGVGPTWQGLYGKQEQLETGTAKVDEAFLKEAITIPNSKRVKGFQPVMPKIPLDNNQVSALIAYIKTLSGPPAGGVAKQ